MKKPIVLFVLLIIAGWVLFYFKLRPPKGPYTKQHPLVSELQKVLHEDQMDRMKIDSIVRHYGPTSPQLHDLWKRINHYDSMNLAKVRNILDNYGWPGVDTIGPEGSTAIFLVIQHAQLETQEKYVPLMRKAVARGVAPAHDLAMLEDRILTRMGKRQRYGSQIGFDSVYNKYYVLPLEDPDNVDKRRISVGLQPLSAYLMNWQIHWDPVLYKQMLPELEKRIWGNKEADFKTQ
jgi:hypothetical protein